MSKVYREDVDKLTNMDADYPHDDAVPELPPVPDAVNPPPPPDNWNWSHFNDDVHPQRTPYDPPLTDVVTEEAPLGLTFVGRCAAHTAIYHSNDLRG